MDATCLLVRFQCGSALTTKSSNFFRIETPTNSAGACGRSLLDDIAAKRVDTVVVYKVDRLTRSLADFAKIVEQFDKQGISFVSVTQQFNTTTSMRRLALNVLLSFARFEWEVTGERIRDKIAASKRKGMWVGGGVVPLGYDLEDRHLAVNPKEATRVKDIFQAYLSEGCVSKLQIHLETNNIRSKKRLSKTGNASGDNASPVERSIQCSRIGSTWARSSTKTSPFPASIPRLSARIFGIVFNSSSKLMFRRRGNDRAQSAQVF